MTEEEQKQREESLREQGFDESTITSIIQAESNTPEPNKNAGKYILYAAAAAVTILLAIVLFAFFSATAMPHYEIINIDKSQALVNKYNVGIKTKVFEKLDNTSLKRIIDEITQKHKSAENQVLVWVFDYHSFPDADKHGPTLWVAMGNTNYSTNGLNAKTDYNYQSYEDLRVLYEASKP